MIKIYIPNIDFLKYILASINQLEKQLVQMKKKRTVMEKKRMKTRGLMEETLAVDLIHA